MPGRRLRSRASAPECKARPLPCTVLVDLVSARAAPAQPRVRARVPGALSAVHSVSRLDQCAGLARHWAHAGNACVPVLKGLLHCWLGLSQAAGPFACSQQFTAVMLARAVGKVHRHNKG